MFELTIMHPIGNKAPTSIPASLAAWLRERRRANRMNQAELALLAGVGRRFVSDMENAKASLRLDKVDAVLKVFGKQLGIVERERVEAVREPEGTAGRKPRSRRSNA